MAKNKINLIKDETAIKLKNGEYGNSGSAFMTIRKFAEKENISYLSSYRIFNSLNQEGSIILYGKKYYISNGLMKKNSELNVNIRKRATGNYIGLHLNNIQNPLFAALSNEIKKCLDKYNFKLLTMFSNFDANEEKNILLEFLKLGVKGIFSCPGFGEIQKKLYENYMLPFVLLGRNIPSLKSNYVLTDNYESGMHAAKHLIACGYKNFAYIGTKVINDYTSDDRLNGFSTELGNNKLNLDKSQIFFIDPKTPESFNLLRHFLYNLKGKKIGFFCYHDDIAVNLINQCHLLNINIPEQIGVIGFDNLPISLLTEPTITTYSYNLKEFAELAVSTLIKKINSSDAVYESHKITANLIIRESTKPE